MAEPSQEQVRTVWRQMAQRNEWRLVVDEAQFFEQVALEMRALSHMQQDSQITLAIQFAYSMLLYRGIKAHEDRAAQELWRSFFRRALRDTYSPEDASDLAQESVARIIEKLNSLERPNRLLSWAMMVFQAVCRDFRRPRQRETQQRDEHNDQSLDPQDPVDTATVVEQQIISDQLIGFLRSVLTNDLELQVLLRVIILGDKPCDVVRALGLPPARIRLAKSRAVKRLRENAEFMEAIRTHPAVSHLVVTARVDDDES